MRLILFLGLISRLMDPSALVCAALLEPCFLRLPQCAWNLGYGRAVIVKNVLECADQSACASHLPSAADALTARLIERAGFPAYQIGGFALVGAMHAVPDIDLEHFGEKHIKAREIIKASKLPVLVDGDDGYGDVKNVTRTVRGYEEIGASALFIEDQKPPKRCGHMAGKEVIPADQMVEKIRAAIAARTQADFFILARTDAREPLGLA